MLRCLVLCCAVLCVKKVSHVLCNLIISADVARASVQKCTPVNSIIVRLQGEYVADLLYTATASRFQNCKLLNIVMLWLQLQFAKVNNQPINQSMSQPTNQMLAVCTWLPCVDHNW